MVALSKNPEELHEALLGEGRMMLKAALPDGEKIVNECMRVYFEFVNE